MSSLKETLFLPKTNFSMKANLVQKQEKFSKFWLNSQIYQKRLEQNKDNPKFVVMDGPPYANGSIHMGHALNKILKDLIVRWKNISGFYSDLKLGWDMHGLPIESKLEKEIKDFKSLPITEKIKKSLNYALSQVSIQANQLSKLNLSFPCIPSYLTSNSDFIENEYFIFKELFAKNLIFQEYKPVAWSYSSLTALADSELNYEDSDCDSIYFTWEIISNLPFELEKAQIILWTTTPYSLEANLAIVFNPSLKYSFFKYQENIYLSSNTFISNIPEILGWENSEIKVIGEINAEKLSNLKYHNSLTGEENSIFPANFLVEGKGSGFVHTAPGLGEEDYLICKKNNIQPYCAIDEKGIFFEKVKFSPIAKVFYQEASKIVIEFLQKKEQLLKVHRIKHRIGKDWRTNLPILYRSTKQWFLNLDTLKRELNSLFSKKIFTQPPWLFSKLKDQLNSRAEWCISRQRAWGLPIPIIFKEEEIFGGLEQLSRNIEIITKEGIDSWYLKPISYFVENLSPEEEKKLSKCTDTLDVWFDSGSAFFLNRSENNEVIPSDLYVEGGDQLRGWFNSSSILSLLIKKELPFKALVAHGFVLDEKGHKMSKSKGNVIDPLEIISKFGSDIFRLWIINSNFLKDLKFSENQMNSIQLQYRKIRNILFKFSLSVLGKLKWEELKLDSKSFKYPENEYIYLIFLETISFIENELNLFNFHKVIKKIIDFIDLYSSWYLEIVKPILYSSSPENPYKKEVITVISVVLKYSLLLFSIFLPQTAEEVYSHLDLENKKDSIWLENWDVKNLNKEFYSENREKWDTFFSIKNKLFSLMEEKYSTKEFNSLKEVSLTLSDKLIKDFETEDLRRMLGVAELHLNSEEKELKISKSSNSACERCLLYCYKDIKSHLFKGKDYLLCPCCIELLRKS
ncbi:isoleucine--tRNA ligase [Mycoplasma parvum]|uniref:Isoleucine--tRNA ligase n=1 Tax=Mycoplasma parvum str. Indiana TaxID=1403316 RepID=U5NG10_9MOLU|nr:isoleucine--tRNA ligase [Mycoplasma parvum]AGX89193.1 isoleucyl-tRNA synthetase [Mycoplasma parvum str. Indiana]